MLFCTWMKRTYLNDNSDKGCLARLIKEDVFYFNKNRKHKYIKQYLILHNASESIINAFEECWEEYSKCEKRI